MALDSETAPFTQNEVPLTEETLNDLFAEKTVEEKMDLAWEIIRETRDPKIGVAVLRMIDSEKRFVKEPATLVELYDRVFFEDNLDPYIRATAMKLSAATIRQHHIYPDSREFYMEAFAIHPERTEEELNQKTDIYYQIIQDDWYSGRWEKALKGYLIFASDFSRRQPKLHILSYFEAIPVLVMEIDKERAQRKELEESPVIFAGIKEGDQTDSAGWLLALAAIQMARKNYSEALVLAQKAQELSDREEWDIFPEFLRANICFIQKEFGACKDILNSLANNRLCDEMVVRFISTSTSQITKYHPNQYAMSIPIFEWFLESPLYRDEARRKNLPSHIVAHILINYAITLLYKPDSAQSAKVLEEVYTRYPDTDMGQKAFLLLAESFIQQRRFSEAELLIEKVAANVGLDKEMKIQTDLARIKLRKAQKQYEEAEPYKNNILGLPEQIGDEDMNRAKKEAEGD